MKKFKIITERILFEKGEEITDENITHKKEIECDYIKYNYLINDGKDIIVTEESKNYKIGDVIKILDTVSFFKKRIICDCLICRETVLIDPYYELYEFDEILNDWKLIDYYKK